VMDLSALMICRLEPTMILQLERIRSLVLNDAASDTELYRRGIAAEQDAEDTSARSSLLQLRHAVAVF